MFSIWWLQFSALKYNNHIFHISTFFSPEIVQLCGKNLYKPLKPQWSCAAFKTSRVKLFHLSDLRSVGKSPLALIFQSPVDLRPGRRPGRPGG